MVASLLVLAVLVCSRGVEAQLVSTGGALDGALDEQTYQVEKRDVEFNQYVPSYRLRGEPSCEELRAMWRLSKREARRATSTNQLPRSRPYRYGRFRAFASPAVYGPRPISFGTMSYDNRQRHQYHRPQKGALNKLRALIGGGRPGAFNDLREMVAKERTEDETPRGRYDSLRGVYLKEVQQDDNPVVHNLRARDHGGPGISSRRDPSVPLRPPPSFQKEGFSGRLYPGNPKLGAYEQEAWPVSLESVYYDNKDCAVVQGSACSSEEQCACDGQYICSDYRCVVLPNGLLDQFGLWYYEALPSNVLRRWPQHNPDQE